MAKVKVYSDTVQEYLDGEHGVREVLMERAERVLSAAQASAASFRRSGRFADGLAIREDRTDRLAIRVGSDAPHAHLVEARHGTMARALDAAGGS